MARSLITQRVTQLQFFYQTQSPLPVHFLCTNRSEARRIRARPYRAFGLVDQHQPSHVIGRPALLRAAGRPSHTFSSFGVPAQQALFPIQHGPSLRSASCAPARASLGASCGAGRLLACSLTPPLPPPPPLQHALRGMATSSAVRCVRAFACWGLGSACSTSRRCAAQGAELYQRQV